MVRPVVPIIAPAERSNSPPIISMATATAMMPTDEALKIHVLAPAGSTKASVWVAKNRKMTRAPTMAPISGRRRILRATRAILPRRSSGSGCASGASAGGSAVVVLM